MDAFRRRATRRSRALDAASISDLITEPIQRGASPGLIAAVIDRRGVRAVAAAGVRKAGHSQPLLATDSVHIGSNTKAMTSTMLAVLAHDGAFASGWNTTIAEVFPELRADVHPAYHPVTLWQLVTMTGGIKPDAADWHAHGDACLVQRRYRIVRDNLVDPAAAAVGKHLYSNLGYAIAGATAERVTARSWESLMQERLFEPLGITSGFGAPGVPGDSTSLGATNAILTMGTGCPVSLTTPPRLARPVPCTSRSETGEDSWPFGWPMDRQLAWTARRWTG